MTIIKVDSNICGADSRPFYIAIDHCKTIMKDLDIDMDTISLSNTSVKSPTILGTTFKMKSGKINVELYIEPINKFADLFNIKTEALILFILIHEASHSYMTKLIDRPSMRAEESLCDFIAFTFIKNYYPENHTEIRNLIKSLRSY